MHRILVADKSESSRIILKAVLKDEGYTVILTDNPFHVNYFICKENPDLLITEVVWPKINTLHYLDTVIRICNKPIIIHTEVKDLKAIKQFINIGANDYLPKPLQADILLKMVKEYTVHY
ncbi:MAG: response regulator [Bacteroidales bacterium]|nr:response regulator [Bacteroidales bacterium]